MSVAIHCRYDELVKPEELKPHPKNPNTHPEGQLQRLSNFVIKSGWRHPVIVSQLSGFIVAGHARCEVAKRLNISCPVVYQFFNSNNDELSFLLADNKLAELAIIDEELLRLDLSDLIDADVDVFDLGFDFDFSEEMREPSGKADRKASDPVTEQLEELKIKWGVGAGQIWQLGRHRLLCGDSSDAFNVSKLLGGKSYETVIFDPEWNEMPAAIKAKSVLAFCDGFTLGSVVERYGPPIWLFVWDCVTCWYTPNRPLRRIKLCAWYGDLSLFNFNGAHYGEPGKECLVSNTRGSYNFVPDARGKHLADLYVEPITKVHASKEHRHSKPIDWIRLLIGDCTTGIIYDPFCGSGSSIVAAEQLNRTCYGVELLSENVAVILQRFLDSFGIMPVKVGY